LESLRIGGDIVSPCFFCGMVIIVVAVSAKHKLALSSPSSRDINKIVREGDVG